MKNLKKLGIILLLFLFVTSCIQQQRYVSYKVKKGETISSIAKRYGMTEGELLSINPGIGKKPPVNTTIIVPEKKDTQKTDIPNTKPVKKYGIYTVKKGDTLFRLSKQFGMTIDELKETNPILKDGLKTGMEILYVKGNEVNTTPKTKIDNNIEGYEIHEVTKGDTVYNLTHRYHISQEELYSLNPELSKGLKLGMILKIRKKETPNEKEKEVKDNENTSSLLLDNLSTGKSVNIAVMLPYQLNRLNSNETISKKFESKNSLTNISTDFHEGALMAIDSLKRRGVQVNIQFFDTENSQRKLGKLILNNDFSKYDAIIGPLFFDKAKLIASQVKTPVIMPFYSKKQMGNTSDNLLKSMPSNKNTEEKLLNYIKQNYNNEKILVVTDDKKESKSRLWRVVNQLKSFKKIKKIAVLKPKKGYIDRERFKTEIEKEANNWVILIGDDVVTTTDVVNNLGVFPDNQFHIRLFSFDKGNNFNKVDNNYLGKLHFTYPTSTYNDIFNRNVKHFYKNFKSKNNNLPSEYALRGFDVTYDVIARIVSYKTLNESLEQGKSTRLISVFDYNKNQNNGLILVQYNKNLKPEVIE